MPSSEKWGDWDVAEDGLLSLDGMSIFPIYNALGHIGGTFMSYYLRDRDKGIVEAKEGGNPWQVKT